MCVVVKDWKTNAKWPKLGLPNYLSYFGGKDWEKCGRTKIRHSESFLGHVGIKRLEKVQNDQNWVLCIILDYFGGKR